MSRIRKLVTGGLIAATLAIGVISHARAIGYIPPLCSSTGIGIRANGSVEAGGTIRRAWVVTNLSRTACYVTGHPMLQLYGTLGRPFHFLRQPVPPGSGPVGLAPGGSATMFTSYGHVTAGRRCPTSGVMAVVLPQGRGTLATQAVMHLCGALRVSGFVRGVHAP